MFEKDENKFKKGRGWPILENEKTTKKLKAIWDQSLQNFFVNLLKTRKSVVIFRQTGCAHERFLTTIL